MGASAPDIITYIGVPLAVLGVLPIIYTFINSVFTLRHVQRILRRNNVLAMTRSSLISGLIEVEIPRMSLQPLDRDDPEYFRTRTSPSQLKGGSWTALFWRELNVGTKVYRIMYHDDLLQPSAEIDLEPLIAFLLDRGAVPSQEGFADLRSGGLWTPTGTKLLFSPNTADPVLSVGSSENSDGVLTLQLEWRAEWDRRGLSDLPPYWTRIFPPNYSQESDIGSDEKKVGGQSVEGMEEHVDVKEMATPPSPSSVAPTDCKTTVESTVLTKEDPTPDSASQKSINALNAASRTSSIRLKIGTEGLSDCFYEASPGTFFPCRHLRTRTNEPSSMAMWFTSGATALRAHEGALWAYSIPSSILAVSSRETMPCGVMVLLGFMDDSQVPAWRTPSDVDDKMEAHEARIKSMNRLRAFAAEGRLPPGERAAATMARMRQEGQDMIDDMQRTRLATERKKEIEIGEALRSQRVSVRKIADAARTYLSNMGEMAPDASTANVVEKLLWDMMHSPTQAHAVVEVLDKWTSFAEAGGMTRVHYDEICNKKVPFAFASCLLALIADNAAVGAGSVVSDMQECLRMWKKVRVG